jgi:hypothetical protein
LESAAEKAQICAMKTRRAISESLLTEACQEARAIFAACDGPLAAGVPQMSAIAPYRIAAKPSHSPLAGLLRKLLSLAWSGPDERLDPAALSDYMRRDIGLADGRAGRPRDL